jgi:hypothetical protein
MATVTVGGESGRKLPPFPGRGSAHKSRRVNGACAQKEKENGFRKLGHPMLYWGISSTLCVLWINEKCGKILESKNRHHMWSCRYSIPE